MNATRFINYAASAALLAICLFFAAPPAPAEALSETARQRLLLADPEFAAAEAALDGVWEKLAGRLPRPALEPYLANLLRWRDQGRDLAVQAALGRFFDNPHSLPNSLLDERGLPDLAALYVKVTRERVKLMDLMATQFAADKAAVIPGWVDRRGEGADINYTFTPYGWITPLRLGGENELLALPRNVRDLIRELPDAEYDTVIILSGYLNDDLNGFDLRAGLKLEKPESKGWIEWDSGGVE